jgi:hypothetical protein
MIQAIKKEEAKTKRCPMGMLRPELNICCVGDRCVAWEPCVTYEDKAEKGYCGLVGRKS